MEKDGLAKSSDTSLDKEGFISQSLSKDGIPNQSLSADHIGIENISVEPNKLYEAVSALRNYGFNYLPCQGGYDEGPGKRLVSFYHFITASKIASGLGGHPGRYKSTAVSYTHLTLPTNTPV